MLMTPSSLIAQTLIMVFIFCLEPEKENSERLHFWLSHVSLLFPYTELEKSDEHIALASKSLPISMDGIDTNHKHEVQAIQCNPKTRLKNTSNKHYMLMDQ